jgi:hypothetical protein
MTFIAEKALSTDVVATGKIKANSMIRYTNGTTTCMSLSTILTIRSPRSLQLRKSRSALISVMNISEDYVHNLTLWGHLCYLASRLHIFIKIFVYLLALVVLSSITKKGEIVRKMDLDPFD